MDERDFWAGIAMHALIVSAPNMEPKDRAKRAWEIADELGDEWLKRYDKKVEEEGFI